MSTERRTDCGDYWLIEVGEPTVDDPSVWFSQSIEWKPGTPEYINEHARIYGTAAVGDIEVFLALDEEDKTLDAIREQVTLQANVLHELIPLIVSRLP